MSIALLLLWLLFGPPAPAAAQEAGAGQPAAARAEDDPLHRLAALELRISVDGDVAGAEQALAELVAELRAESPASLDDPLVSAARQRVEKLLADARRQDTAAYEQAIVEAFVNSDIPTLRHFGDAAVDLLLRWAEAEDGEINLPRPDGRVLRFTRLQCLIVAVQVDASRTLDWLLARQARDLPPNRNDELGPLVDIALNSEAWTVVPGHRPEPLEPRWVDFGVSWFVRAGAMQDPIVSQRLMFFLKRLAFYDAIPAGLSGHIAEHVRDLDRSRAGVFLDVAIEGSNSPAPSARPIVEALLRHPIDTVRVKAVQMIGRYPDATVVAPLADDPSEAVRRSVAETLRGRRVHEISWPQRDANHRQQSDQWVTIADPASRAALARLARDAAPAVREAALASIATLPVPLEAGVYLGLARDPDPGVRMSLVRTPLQTGPLAADVLAVLAADPDPLVAAVVDARLPELDWDDPVGSTWLPVAEARFANTRASIESIGKLDRERLLRYVAKNDAGRVLLARQALATGDDRPLAAVAAVLAPPNEMPRYDLIEARLKGWFALPPADLVTLFRRMEAPMKWGFDELGTVFAFHGPPSSPELLDAMAALVRDRSASPIVRLWLACRLAKRAQPEDQEALLELLADPAVVAAIASGERDAGQAFSNLPVSLDPAARNGVLMRALALGSLPDGICLKLLDEWQPGQPDAEPLARVILDRWLDEPAAMNVVLKALEVLAHVDWPDVNELLDRATRQPQLDLPSRAVEVMGKRRDPATLPRLDECLRGVDIGPREEAARADLQSIAAQAIQNFMTEEAAELLIQASARVADADVRSECLAGAETIRRYLDSLAEWQRRKASRATREAAVTALLPMLDAQAWETRREAARALGTLGAVEHLPHLIRLLQDENGSVREAAQEALDRLNSLPGAAGEGASGAADQATQGPP